MALEIIMSEMIISLQSHQAHDSDAILHNFLFIVYAHTAH